jgi:hypothetical protein
LQLLPTALRERLARTHFASQAIADKADLSAFGEKPTPRLILGLLILALSFLLGWPAVAACGIAAVYFEEPLVLVVGGPGIYGFSWLLWAVSVYLLGKESYTYGRVFLRWAVRRMLE